MTILDQLETNYQLIIDQLKIILNQLKKILIQLMTFLDELILKLGPANDHLNHLETS